MFCPREKETSSHCNPEKDKRCKKLLDAHKAEVRSEPPQAPQRSSGIRDYFVTKQTWNSVLPISVRISHWIKKGAGSGSVLRKLKM